MKSKADEKAQRILLLLKLDSTVLFDRIKKRSKEYIAIFAQKRNRDHFKQIFYSRYDSATFGELIHCGQDVIVAVHQFYNLVDEIRWYLQHTEDMPGSMQDRINGYIRNLQNHFDTLNLYIDAELGYENSNERQDNKGSFSQDNLTLTMDDSLPFNEMKMEDEKAEEEFFEKGLDLDTFGGPWEERKESKE